MAASLQDYYFRILVQNSYQVSIAKCNVTYQEIGHGQKFLLFMICNFAVVQKVHPTVSQW